MSETLPEKLLNPRTRWVSSVQLPSDEGIGPVNLLRPRMSLFSLVNFIPKSSGMVPWKKLPKRSRILSSVKFMRMPKINPEKEFPSNTSVSRLESKAISGGKLPFNEQ